MPCYQRTKHETYTLNKEVNSGASKILEAEKLVDSERSDRMKN